MQEDFFVRVWEKPLFMEKAWDLMHETLAWCMWRCSSTWDLFDEVLYDLAVDKIDWRQHCYVDNGQWWLLKVGSWGRGSPLIEDNYSLTLDVSFCLYSCLDLRIWLLWLLFWSLLILLACIFEYMDLSNLLDEIWYVDPSWGSFEMQEKKS